MTVKKRSVLLSTMTIMIALALAAGGSYALFSDQVTVKNHLYSDSLNISLIRTHLVTASPDDETGFLKGSENPEDMDFSRPTSRNVFDLSEKTLIVPGCYYTAEMKIVNSSNMTVGYWLEITLSGNDYPDLAQQIRVTVTTADGKLQAVLSKGTILSGNESNPIGILTRSNSALFTVHVEFLDLDGDANNTAKDQRIDFDLIVHTVQIPSPSA